jgi:uncharacterized membrane protein (DUF485 family)
MTPQSPAPPIARKLAPEDWDRIARSPGFQRMTAEKTRFVVAATLFFLVYYFALPILVGYWPEMMKREVLGALNWAYLFALSQFFMAWILAYFYMRISARFDRMSAEIVVEALDEQGKRTA